MLEYFTYKKVKKYQAEKRARESSQNRKAKPVLSAEDESFLQRIVSEGTPPPLPERPIALDPEIIIDKENGAQLESLKGKGNEKEKKKPHRFSKLFMKTKEGVIAEGNVSPAEAEREEDDITRVLNDLNLSAVNNHAFSLSKESNELVKKFTVILKDLVNGVPTAYDDLTKLLDDSQGTLAKSYEHLPSFLKKLVTSLPEKLTSTFAPELLAVATEAQGLNMEGASAAAGGGFMGAAKAFLKPNSLKDLVTKPGAVAGMLKAVMNALKLRWPAFMGTNVLLSLGLFVLLFVFWYCHKRGKEVRLAAEGKDKVVDSNEGIVQLDDDPLLEGRATQGPEPRRSHDSRRLDEPRDSSRTRSHRHSRSGGSHRSEGREDRVHDKHEERK